MIGMNEALILEKRKDILDEILLALRRSLDDISLRLVKTPLPSLHLSLTTIPISWC